MNEQPGGLRLSLSCVIDAPRERIFGMLTEPAEVAKWWGPRGFTMPRTELDLRVGGRYRFWMQPPDGDLFHVSGEYLEISRPSRLVYTFRWDEPTPDDRETVVTLLLRVPAALGGTEVSLSQESFTTEERLELHRGGWTDSLARLREVIEIDQC
jgi:uncharacterized protein YndB with AHSA1/START domain